MQLIIELLASKDGHFYQKNIRFF